MTVSGHLYKGDPTELLIGYPPGINPGIPARLENVAVSVVVDKNKESTLFTYTYTVSNQSLQNQQIYKILVDLKQSFEDSVLPNFGQDNSCGSTFGKPAYLNFSKVLTVPATLYRPVGKHLNNYGGQVYNWNCGVDSTGRAIWSSSVTERYTPGKQIGIVPATRDLSEGKIFETKSYEVEYFLIQPGETQSGFKIVSPGLPGIRQFDAEQMVAIAEDEYPPDMKSIKELYDGFNFHGHTVGPVAPPAAFTPHDFISYLESVITEAVKIQWVDVNNKQLKNIREVLLKAKHYLEDELNNKAILELSKLYENIISAGCVTGSENDCNSLPPTEAQLYLILAYNIEYLLSRM